MCAGLFGDVLTCGLRGQGRRDWVVGLKYEVESYDYIGIDLIMFYFYIYYTSIRLS